MTVRALCVSRNSDPTAELSLTGTLGCVCWSARGSNRTCLCLENINSGITAEQRGVKELKFGFGPSCTYLTKQQLHRCLPPLPNLDCCITGEISVIIPHTDGVTRVFAGWRWKVEGRQPSHCRSATHEPRTAANQEGARGQRDTVRV